MLSIAINLQMGKTTGYSAPTIWIFTMNNLFGQEDRGISCMQDKNLIIWHLPHCPSFTQRCNLFVIKGDQLQQFGGKYSSLILSSFFAGLYIFKSHHLRIVDVLWVLMSTYIFYEDAPHWSVCCKRNRNDKWGTVCLNWLNIHSKAVICFPLQILLGKMVRSKYIKWMHNQWPAKKWQKNFQDLKWRLHLIHSHSLNYFIRIRAPQDG